ncbi:MAG TPA: KilA-N domain-containing protein [Bacteroidales bacterium]|nr:KilA-N domain-containing protein [Bacteroidales bacterium]
MEKTNKINAVGTEIAILKTPEAEFISVTDIARHKDAEHMDSIIQNWMRNRNTIELSGFWKLIYNTNFKPL